MIRVSNQLMSIQPGQIMFQIELGQQCLCDLLATNLTEHCVAFKMKTNYPKKYYVRPHTGVILPWESCIIRVIHQAESEYPPDMQCKDKFQIQTIIVPPETDVFGLPPDLFDKEPWNSTEVLKLKVVYMTENDPTDESINEVLKQLKNDRDSALEQVQALQQELAYMVRRREVRLNPAFSVPLTILVGLMGLIFGFFTRLLFFSRSA